MASPVICVMKPDNPGQTQPQVRLVCDFRYLNCYTQSDPFPVPDQEEILNKLGNFKYISVFDAYSGYWQTEVRPECQWLLGFVTHHGLWEWTPTPFGCKNSGSTFLRAIQEVLQPIKQFTACYVDDMGVGADTWEQHLVNLREFFIAIRDAGVTLNLSKSDFAKP